MMTRKEFLYRMAFVIILGMDLTIAWLIWSMIP